MLFRSHAPIEYGKWETVKKSQSDVYVLCSGGRTLDIAEKAAKARDMNIVNCRFAKPLDTEFLKSINKRGNIVVTMEDNVARGGFGESVLAYLNGIGNNVECRIIAHKDEFIDDRDVDSSLAESGLAVENLTKLIKSLE